MKQSLKPKSTGKTVVIVLLFLVIACLGGYIVYDKLLGEQPVEKKEGTSVEEKEEEQELSVDSRLVQSLYQSVTDTNGIAQGYVLSPHWMYQDEKQSDVSSMEEETKMKLVYINLPESAFTHVDCEQEGIENTKTIENATYEMCKADTGASRYENAIDKEVVETVYQKLFGTAKKLDTSVVIYMTGEKSRILSYVPQFDQYVMYDYTTGGIPQGIVETEITKAVQSKNTVKIYEHATESSFTYENNETTPTKNKQTEEDYIYTFKLENDGIYTFQSREKDPNA